MKTLFTGAPPLDWSLEAKRRMRALPIVVPEPLRKDGGPLERGAVRRGVRPPRQTGPDEALRFAVGLGPIGSRPEVAQVEPAPEELEALRPAAGAVIGHQGRDCRLSGSLATPACSVMAQ